MADNIKIAKENLEAMRGYIDKKNYTTALVCARNAYSTLSNSKFKAQAGAIVSAMIAKKYMDAIRGANALIPYLK